MQTNRFYLFLQTNKIAIKIAIFVLGAMLFRVHFFTPPDFFPTHVIYTVEKGQSVSEVAESLAEKKIIRSPFLFKSIVTFLDHSGGIKAGDYFFAEPCNVYVLAKRFTKAEYGIVPTKITVPEGYNVFQIAELLKKHLNKFNSEQFIVSAKEGYLFPDTYLFPLNSTAGDVISIMEKNFNVKTKDLTEDIKMSGKSLDDIVNMASILEEEARTTETRQIISGILWKRIEIGMPLQVDVTFQYVNGKNSYELSAEDLKIDSPYNTYQNVGLPPTAISNPGYDSIVAALKPTSTPYLYFLSSKAGVMYYAKDFQGHKKNRELYLN